MLLPLGSGKSGHGWGMALTRPCKGLSLGKVDVGCIQKLTEQLPKVATYLQELSLIGTLNYNV